MPTYKVIEQKQKKFLRGQMRAKDLEKVINQGAEGGWSLDRIIAGETYAFLTGGKDVFLLVFKKDD